MRSGNELSRVEVETDEEKKRIRDGFEMTEKQHQEAVRDIWSMFPGYSEYEKLSGELEQVERRIQTVESFTEEKRKMFHSGMKRLEEIEKKKQILEALTNQLNNLKGRQAELRAKNERLLHNKAAARRAQEASQKAAQEAAAKAAQEAAAKATQEASAKASQEAAAKAAQEAAAKAAQEASAKASQEAAVKASQEAAANQAEPTAAYEDEQEFEMDDESRDYDEDDEITSEPNWTLPMAESVPPLMKLSMRSSATSDVDQISSSIDYSTSLAESTPANNFRNSYYKTFSQLTACC